jgi:hypothetical protein
MQRFESFSLPHAAALRAVLPRACVRPARAQ